jgi:hypothetical protein
MTTAGGGDVFVRMFVPPSSYWSFGVDNSDADIFKIHTSSSLADPSVFELDRSGNLVLAGGIALTGDLSAANVYVPDGGTVGISGNELFTFAAAGTITVNGANLVLSGTNQVQFGDDATFIHQSADSILTYSADGRHNFVGLLDLQTTTSSTGQITQNGGTRLIHTYGTNNFFAGTSAGNFTTSGTGGLVGIGVNALAGITTGFRAVAIGLNAMNQATTTRYSIGIGYAALQKGGGWGSVVVGPFAMQDITFAGNAYDVAIGYQVLDKSVTTQRTTAVGAFSGFTGTANSDSVYLGYQAGYYETASNKLFIDNAKRASEADGRVKALVYGIFDAATANQYFTVNGHLSLLEDALIQGTSKWTFNDANKYVQWDATDFKFATDSGEFKFTGGSIETDSGEYVYIGDAGTNGTWRMGRSGDDMVFERRESGSYVTKMTIED